MICDKPATLVYLANQACIEMHAFLSRIGALDRADQLIFDLDPPDDNRFDEVKYLALRLRELLEDELGLTAFVKTTGGKGLHVHVPLNARDDFDTVRRFARQASEVLAAREPDILTIRAAQGQPRRPRLLRRHAQRLRPDRGRALLRAGAGRARPSPPRWTGRSWRTPA